MNGMGVKRGKTGKMLSAFFAALNSGLKLADDTKFILGANDAVKTLDTAENVLKTKFRRTREAIKIAQSGSRLLT